MVVSDDLQDNQRVEVLLGGGVIVTWRVRLVGGRVVMVPDSKVPAFELGAGAMVRVVTKRRPRA